MIDFALLHKMLRYLFLYHKISFKIIKADIINYKIQGIESGSFLYPADPDLLCKDVYKIVIKLKAQKTLLITLLIIGVRNCQNYAVDFFNSVDLNHH